MRVIAGEHGGRRLVAPRGTRTRPTSDRVREALFMSLEPLAGLRVVDLYAGSGALGIEALSRGAAFVDFVENDREALRALRGNLATLGLEARAAVWPLALPRALRRLEGVLHAADLVLLDPPYGGGPARETLEWLGRPAALREGCRVVAERHARDVLPAACGRLEAARERAYGETVICQYRVTEPGASGVRPPS
jgi:16S rRNA (guanine(966)-N(2))-methyltransferase RsmD